MTTPYTGGCRCGAVRYECSAEPMFPGNCYCRQCQKASGSGHVSAFAVPQEALAITGEVKYFDHRADSGNTASNGFCPECGAAVVGKSSGMPGLVAIKAASLDDPSWFKPGMNIFTASAQPWDSMDPNLPEFEGMPEL
jgi:hypothetical protein